MGKQVITVDDIRKAAASGCKTLDLIENACIVTPGARDKMQELGIGFAGDRQSGTGCSIPPASNESTESGVQDIQSVTGRVCAILKDRLPGANATEISAIVKKVVESKFAKAAPITNDSDSSAITSVGGVSLICGDRLLDKDSGQTLPGKVQISDAIRCHEDTHLVATYMKWEKSAFARTVEAPEISIIIEGEVDIIAEGRSMKAKAGDILYMAKGSKVEYNTPSMVKLACVSS